MFIIIVFFFFHSSKKRTITISDDEDVFAPRYVLCIIFIWATYWFWFSPVHDSPTKKVRVKEPSTPSKIIKNAGRQLVFDKAVYVNFKLWLNQYPHI